LIGEGYSKAEVKDMIDYLVRWSRGGTEDSFLTPECATNRGQRNLLQEPDGPYSRRVKKCWHETLVPSGPALRFTK